MVSHFDITTGELIASDDGPQTAVATPRLAETPALRLLTVQETLPLAHPRTPGAILMRSNGIAIPADD